MDVLQQWGWPALPIAGDGNIQLDRRQYSGRCAVEADDKNGRITRGQRAKRQITNDASGRGVSAGSYVNGASYARYE